MATRNEGYDEMVAAAIQAVVMQHPLVDGEYSNSNPNAGCGLARVR